MEAFVEWLLTPEAERDPRTKTELAELLGVTTATLRNYTQDPFVQRELARRSRSLAKVERIQPILDSLYEQAKNPNHPRAVQAAKVFLDWVDKVIDMGDPKDVENLTDEELFTLMTRLKEKLGV